MLPADAVGEVHQQRALSSSEPSHQHPEVGGSSGLLRVRQQPKRRAVAVPEGIGEASLAAQLPNHSQMEWTIGEDRGG